MRAPQPRALLCAALLTAAPLACTKNNPNTNVKIADGETPGAGESARVSDTPDARPSPRNDLQKIQMSGSVFGVNDMLDAASKLITMWSPPEPGAPPINLKSLLEVGLVQEGFGPGFLESIDLDAVHAVEFAIPHDGQPQSDADIELRMALSATQPVRAVESLPADMRPQPIGQNIWQLIEDDVQLLFRAQADALEIAMSMPDLDVASGLRQKVPFGPNDPRIRMAASNLPPGEIDVSDMIPLPPEFSRPLSSILNETSAVDFAADFGTDRDLIGRVGANAPFDRLGLDPIGPATQAPSELAKSLPGDAMFVWLMPWGDPAMLHTALDKQIKVDQIPAPFDGYVDEVLKAVHGVLGQVRDEVLIAVYLDGKGQLTIAFAAAVKDEKATQAAMRELWGASEKAFKDHIALVGSTPEHAYSVSFKQGAVKAGKAKADLFTLTAPKDKQDDLDKLKSLVGEKPKLEVSTLVADGKLIVAVGIGQKSFMTELGRTLGKAGDGLETGGLALARKVTDGCQYCVAINPQELGEMILTAHATDPDEPEEVQKAAQEALKKLAKLDFDGEVALALRLDKDRGVFGFGIPKTLLFADPTKVKAAVELMKSIDEARDAAWNKSVAGGVPGGVPGGVAGGG
ncbi:MAG TPA: hypothetical protein VM869_33800 [Enhygromyxa sp.]|nr:hypothetical protein [Enhygromyxa sp.]